MKLELEHKLTVIRKALREVGAIGLRLQSTDWFTWATAGANHTVLRGFGLYADLTRFVCFGQLSSEQQKLHQKVQAIEAAALDRCKVNTPLNQIYNALEKAYEQEGYSQAIREHKMEG